MSWGALLALPAGLVVHRRQVLTDPVWWFFLTWLPDYFKKKWGLDIKKSWVHLVTIYAIITVLSIVGGWLTGYLTRRGWSVTRARKTGMFIFACCVLPIFFATQRRPLGRGAADRHRGRRAPGVVREPVHDHVRHVPEARGGVAGGCRWDGRLARRHRVPDLRRAACSTSMGSAGYAILFGICGSAYLVAFVLNHLLAPRFEPIEIPPGH